jgi:hypothetical protein
VCEKPLCKLQIPIELDYKRKVARIGRVEPFGEQARHDEWLELHQCCVHSEVPDARGIGLQKFAHNLGVFGSIDQQILQVQLFRCK